MRDEVVKVIYEKAKKDKDLILLTGDLGFGVLDFAMKELPNQFINVGISEQNMTGLATGLGLVGKKVISYSIGNFNTLRCLEQIRNDSAYHDINLTIISIGGGFSYGQLGYSHHTTEDYGILRTLPNLEIYTPGSIKESILSINECINSNKVSYLRVDKSFYPDSFCNSKNFKIGINEIIKGERVLIIGVGGVLNEAIKSSDFFYKKNKFKPGVLSISKLKNIDNKKLVGIIKKYDLLITIEEHNKINGLSSIIKEILFDYNINIDLYNLGMKDEYSKVVGDQKFLRNYYDISSNAINSIINDKI